MHPQNTVLQSLQTQQLQASISQTNTQSASRRSTQKVIASNSNNTMSQLKVLKQVSSLGKDRKSIDLIKKPIGLSSLIIKPLDGTALATKAQTHHSISPHNHLNDSFNQNEIQLIQDASFYRET